MGWVRDDLSRALDDVNMGKVACGFCGLLVLLTCILVPASLGKISSQEVAVAYDNINAELQPDVLTEGLKLTPTFGSLVLWPKTNQEVDMQVKCNSMDAIEIDLTLDFLYYPNPAHVYELTLLYETFDNYNNVAYSMSRSAVRNTCGNFTALEFQTLRDQVQESMTQALKDSLSVIHGQVFLLNIRNIMRPARYADAVNRGEAALADIDLAREEERQQLVKANTTIKDAEVKYQEKLDLANSQKNIKITNAVNNIRESSRADIELATQEDEQRAIIARTLLDKAYVEANSTLDTAQTLAEIKLVAAKEEYEATMDRYRVFSEELKQARTDHSLSSKGALAYLGNQIVGKQPGQQIAISPPAQASYRDEL